jgi:hypothetical protein
MNIYAENFKKIPKALTLKWNKKLKNVKSLSDKNTIIFLGEILEILTLEKADFYCSGVVDYDMFSACDYQWNLRAGKCSVTRSLQRDISDGWQRVEVFTDNVSVEGLEKYKFSWNGECGSVLATLKIIIDVNEPKMIEKIEKLGRDLFEKFDFKE